MSSYSTSIDIIKLWIQKESKKKLTIQKAREILGEKGKKYTDEQIEETINTLNCYF